jgi:hypothetical protein
MKKFLGFILMLALAPTGFGQQPRPTPFGFHPGETLEEVTTAVGSKNIRMLEPHTYGTTKPPKPAAGMDAYVLLFGSRGLAKVICSVSVTTGTDGYLLETTYKSIQENLKAVYGNPWVDLNEISSHGTFQARHEFMYALYTKERVMTSLWILSDVHKVQYFRRNLGLVSDEEISKLPPADSITLEISAEDTRHGTVILTYEFGIEYAAYMEEYKQAQQAAFQ